MKTIILSIFLMLMSFTVQAATAVQPLVTMTANTTSTLALAASIERKYLLIQNKGLVSIFLKFNSAHTANEGVEIIKGGYYEPTNVPTNSFFIKSASATSEVAIYEGK